MNLDEIWFMPAYQPPHKASSSLTSFRHRLRMVQLAVDKVDYFRASDIEAKRPGPSYSVDTLNQLVHTLGQEASFFFIIGSDAFLEIETWKDYSLLPILSELVVITRPPWQTADIIKAMKTRFPDYRESGREGLFISAKGGRIRVFLITRMGISSTDIRKRARIGLSTRFLVPEKVRRYMVTNKLYIPLMEKPQKDSGRRTALEAAKMIFEEIRNNKGEKICVLDMRGISPVADFFIIAQGRSTRHVQGMASRMKKDLSRKKIKCRGMEGEDEGKWILLDFEDIIVHLFYEPVRSFYDLEGLWSEAPRILQEEDGQPLEEMNG